VANPREPIDHAFKMSRLNIWFGVSSILMFLIFVAAVFYDHEREWKRVQARWYELERERTAAAIEQATAKVDPNAQQAIDAKIQGAEERVAQDEKKLSEIEERIKALDAKLYKIDQAQRFSKALIASEKYEYEEAVEHGQKNAAEIGAKLEERRQELERVTLELQEAETERAAAEAERMAITGDRDAALKEREALFAERSRSERKLERIAHNFANDWFRNRPLVDFISPLYKINQTVVEPLHNDVNFLTIPRVDRCATCHLGIDQAGYEDAPAPFKSHPRLDLFVGANSPHPMDQFGCTVCHLGRDRATTMVSAAHTPSDEEEAHRWHEEYNWHAMHYWDYPMLKTQYVESSCTMCHQGVVDVPEADKLNHGMFLVENSGCVGCHKIAGREHLPKAGPALYGIAGKTTEEFTFHWIKDPKAFRPTTRMPQFFDLSNTNDAYYLARNNVEARAITSYLFDVSKPKPRDGIPAGLTGDIARGRDLVENVGCRGCHLMDGEEAVASQQYRRFGPPLTGVGSKTTIDWVYNWVKNPKAMVPTTRMPDLRLMPQEAIDIATYLMSLRDPEFEARAMPAPDDTLRDAVLLEFLKVTLTDRDARDSLAAMTADSKDHVLGEKLISRYGCFGCHLIEGFEDAKGIGTELTEEGSKPVKRFDFGFVDIPQTRHDWINQKLEDPRIFDHGKVKDPQEKLKMPWFGFTDEEKEAVTLAVLSMRKRNIIKDQEREPEGREVAAAKGWRIVRDNNCRGCHQIEGEGGDYLQLVSDKGLAPPVIMGEGDRVQAEWLFEFLKNPTSIRPWLSMRMPTFHFTDSTAVDLVRFFEATSPKGGGFEQIDVAELPSESVEHGRQIFVDYKCISCHSLGEATGRDPADLAPDLTLAPSRLRAEWIADWLRDPQQLMPDTRMPSFFYSEGQAMFDDADEQIVALRNYLLTLGKKRGT
jgi:cbb3-type cytochrome oxidase cytochrome c subunit